MPFDCNWKVVLRLGFSVEVRCFLDGLGASDALPRFLRVVGCASGESLKGCASGDALVGCGSGDPLVCRGRVRGIGGLRERSRDR